MAQEPAPKPPAAAPKPTAPPPDAKAAAALKEAQAAGSIGAQIILDYNSDAGKGARGGAGVSVEENTMARDANLVALGLDPNAPSGPPTFVPWVAPSQRGTEPPPAPAGTASRHSSLAAGITAQAAPVK